MQRVLGDGFKEDTYYLHYLATHPDHQGRGIGSALIRPVLKEVFSRVINLTLGGRTWMSMLLRSVKVLP